MWHKFSCYFYLFPYTSCSSDVPVRDGERMTASSYDKALNDILSWAYPNEIFPLLKETVEFSYRE